MKKILLLGVLSTLTTCALADSFQDFNNTAWAQYNNLSVNQGQAGQAQSWTIGAGFQSKNNVWGQVTATGMPNNNSLGVAVVPAGSPAGTPTTTLGGSTYGQFLATAKAGYAFQFLNGDNNGFQVIPYATYTYGTSLGAINQYYGLGVKPEYRLMSSLKFSMDMTAYDATQSGGDAPLQPAGVNPTFWGQSNSGYVQDFRYTINPEVVYDIAKTISVGVGYAYDQTFNVKATAPGMNTAGNSTVYGRVGYLF